MFIREWPYGGWLSILNMAARGVGGVQMRFLGRLGLGEEYHEELEEFSSHTKFEVGDSSKIRFWHDVWCADKVLKATFPDLFNLASCKDASMANHLEVSSDSLQWHVNFLRAAHNWEVDSLNRSSICCTPSN
jgi:hypothetical protein